MPYAGPPQVGALASRTTESSPDKCSSNGGQVLTKFFYNRAISIAGAVRESPPREPMRVTESEGSNATREVTTEGSKATRKRYPRGGSFKCPICVSGFSTEGGLVRHRATAGHKALEERVHNAGGSLPPLLEGKTKRTTKRKRLDLEPEANRLGRGESVRQRNDNEGFEVDSIFNLAECCRRVQEKNGKAGLALHQRQVHSAAFHAAHIPSARIKPRWDREEELLMATEEVRLLKTNLPGAINVLLVAASEGTRTLEAVKGKRRHAGYRELVRALRAGVPQVTETNSSRDRPAVPVCNPPDQSNQGTITEENWKAELGNSILASYDKGKFDFSLNELRSIIEEARSMNEEVLGYHTKLKLDLEFQGFCRAQFLSKRTEGTKAKPRSRGNKERVTATRPRSARQRRRMAYATIQRLYDRNRQACAEKVLEGLWDRDHAQVPLDKQDGYWRGLFSKPSKPDSRNPERVGPVVWELLGSISDDEVDRHLRTMSNGSAGPDGISAKSVKSADRTALAAHFNLWLMCGYQPTGLKEGVTVLIPKVLETAKPSDHRPITMGSVVGRAFHKILAARLSDHLPIDIRQKAFQKGDGIADNSWLLQSLIKDHTDELEPLCVTFIDVKKAFDSVSHDTIILAARRMGVPDRLLSYLRNIYTDVETRLRVEGELSEPISIGQGVRQGDPLSPVLFNTVIDWILAEQDPELSVRRGDQKVGHFAFADDLILLSRGGRAMQSKVGRLTESLGAAGLEVNQLKSASLRIQIDGKAKRWVVNDQKFLTIQGTAIPALSITETYKYLGTQTSASGACSTAKGKLITGLDNLTRAPLKPQQRLFMLNVHLLPSLYHELVFADVTRKTLKELDRKVRASVRTWLRLPHDTATSYFHADIKCGGMGVPSLRTQIPYMKTNRMGRLSESADPLVREMVLNSRSFAKLKAKSQKMLGVIEPLVSKEHLKRRWADELHTKIDGMGLKEHGLVPAVHAWVNSGTKLLTGSNYVKAIKTRGNLHCTLVRAARGQPNKPVTCDCRQGKETLGHILQVCPKTHGPRVKRHDRVVKFVADTALKRGYTVEAERLIPTPAGNRKPDLVIFRAGLEAVVVDITIVSDGARLTAEHNAKVAKYNKGAIREYVAGRAKIAAEHVAFSSVTLNWRGALARESDTLLTSLGFTRREKELVSVRTVEHAYVLYAAHRHSTWRART